MNNNNSKRAFALIFAIIMMLQVFIEPVCAIENSKEYKTEKLNIDSDMNNSKDSFDSKSLLNANDKKSNTEIIIDDDNNSANTEPQENSNTSDKNVSDNQGILNNDDFSNNKDNSEEKDIPKDNSIPENNLVENNNENNDFLNPNIEEEQEPEQEQEEALNGVEVDTELLEMSKDLRAGESKILNYPKVEYKEGEYIDLSGLEILTLDFDSVPKIWTVSDLKRENVKITPSEDLELEKDENREQKIIVKVPNADPVLIPIIVKSENEEDENLTEEQILFAEGLNPGEAKVFKEPKTEYKSSEKITLDGIEIIAKTVDGEVKLFTRDEILEREDIKVTPDEESLAPFNYYDKLRDPEFLKDESENLKFAIAKYIEENGIEDVKSEITIEIPDFENIVIPINVDDEGIGLTPLELFNALKMEKSSMRVLSIDKMTYREDEDLDLSNIKLILKDENGALRIVTADDIEKDYDFDVDTYDLKLEKNKINEEFKSSLDENIEREENIVEKIDAINGDDTLLKNLLRENIDESKNIKSEIEEPRQTYFTIEYKDYKELNVPITIVSRDAEITELEDNGNLDLSNWGLVIDKNKSIFTVTVDAKNLSQVKETELNFLNIDKSESENIKVGRVVKTNGVDEEDITLTDPIYRIVEDLDLYREMPIDELAEKLRDYPILKPLNLSNKLEVGYKYVFFIEVNTPSDEEAKVESEVAVADENVDEVAVAAEVTEENVEATEDSDSNSLLIEENEKNTPETEVTTDKNEIVEVEEGELPQLLIDVKTRIPEEENQKRILESIEDEENIVSREIISTAMDPGAILRQKVLGVEESTYPIRLNYRSHQTLRDQNGKQYVIGPTLPDETTDLSVWWDIEIDTGILKGQDFNYLYITLFGSRNQGLKDFSYKVSSLPIAEDDKIGFITSGINGPELMTANKTIVKSNLPETLYIRVKAPLNDNEYHRTYSLGLRVNPDQNYIKSKVDEFIKQYNDLPFIFKFISGLKEANRFANTPFNLLEEMLTAEIGLSDNRVDELFYYDNSRIITADRKYYDEKTDVRANTNNWYALDLLRIGDTEDPGLESASLRPDNGQYTKCYFVPQIGGGFTRRLSVNFAKMPDGSFKPGTIVAYSYKLQPGTRDTKYNFSANLQDKIKNMDDYVNKVANPEKEGGSVNLSTQYVPDSVLDSAYYAYMEHPYSVMRINKTFELVSCFNANKPDPTTATQNTKVGLEQHLDPSGDYLISRLNKGSRLPNMLLPGGKYNPDGKSQSDAMEDLFKRIYYYENEVKKEYKNGTGNVMHRFVESGVTQKVIHYFTDGKSLSDNFFSLTGSNGLNDPTWKHDWTLTGGLDPITHEPANYFDGDEKNNQSKDNPIYRGLSEKEAPLEDRPFIVDEQNKYAELLLKKVEESYTNGDWNSDKANSVQLVFYSHGKDMQELITGNVTEPIKISKVDTEENVLPGAEFRITNINTGEHTTWTSKEGEESGTLYLREENYTVEEKVTPAGYETIPNFNLVVEREEVNPDNGPYHFARVGDIHVNDGFKTNIRLENVPNGGVDDKPLVTLEDGKLEIKITNTSDSLGKIEFTKKNKSTNLDGAEFTLTKLNANSLEEAKAAAENNDYDKRDEKLVYQKSSPGNKGNFEFTQMPAGYYVLEETKVPEGYKKAPNQILIAETKNIDGKDKVIVRFADEKIESSRVIENEAEKIDIKFRKVMANADNITDPTEKEKAKLKGAKFTLNSIRTLDNGVYNQEQVSDDNGLVEFKGLSVGEYVLRELVAPESYQRPQDLLTDPFFGWKIFVYKDGDSLKYSVYKVKTQEDIKKSEKELEGNEVEIKDIFGEGATNIENTGRTVDWEFKKYIENPDFDETKPESETNQKYISMTDETKLNQITFKLYESDYYGNIKPGQKPVLDNIKAEKNERGEYVFKLPGLKFNGYYRLEEGQHPAGYLRSDFIILKIEAETIANEGEMKVTVRDPNKNTLIGEHALFKGVINYIDDGTLGEFAVKKTGMSIGDNKVEVGLRRAFFRLYTANDDFSIKMNGDYPAEYIQKVTPGIPITQDDGNGNQVPVDPNNLPPNQGIVIFDQLKPGKYVLEEYRGPAGYEKDPNPWYIFVKLVDTVENNKHVKRAVVLKSRDKNDPIFTDSANAANYSTFNEVPTSVKKTNRALAQASPYDDGVIEKTYTNLNGEFKVRANAIYKKDGVRDFEITITPKRNNIPIYINLADNVNMVSFDAYDASELNPDNSFYKLKKDYNSLWIEDLQLEHKYVVTFRAVLNDNSNNDEYYKVFGPETADSIYGGLLTMWGTTPYYLGDAEDTFKIVRSNDIESSYNLKVKFFYNYFNYKGGETGQDPIEPGTFWLESYENGEWTKVEGTDNTAPLKNEAGISIENLDRDKTYRIGYELNRFYDFLIKKWEWDSDTRYYPVDTSNVDGDGNVIVEIANGNLLRVFNHDEDGFRIPLRIAKVNKDESPLTGARFGAKKLVDGEQLKDGSYPKYYDEEYDGFTEATGRAGDNYFRELTPGIYELWEEKAPDDYKKLDNKWYFEVKVNPDQPDPGGENYMMINFNFSYKFPTDLSNKKYDHLTQEEKDSLRGKTIYGLGFNDANVPVKDYQEFVKNVEVIPDNHQSDPARPDAPYKEINVVRVDNYKLATDFDFYKTNNKGENIDGAEFKLTRVKTDENGKLSVGLDQEPIPLLNEQGDKVYSEVSTSSVATGVRFENITEGTYILEEIKAAPGFKKIDSYLVIHFEEDENGELKQRVDEEQSQKEILDLIKLKEESKELSSIANIDNVTSLRFKKLNNAGLAIETSSFRLTEVDKYGDTVIDASGNPRYDVEIKNVSSSNFEFENLKVGRYKLTETNYTIFEKPTPWYFNVVADNEGNLKIIFEKTPTSKIDSIVANAGNSFFDNLKDKISGLFNDSSDKFEFSEETTEKLVENMPNIREGNLIDYSVRENEDGSFNIINYPKVDFKFTKVGKGFNNPEIPISGIRFNLKKVKTQAGDNGIKISYDENGNVISMNDASGKDLLQEVITNTELLKYAYFKPLESDTDGSVNFAGLSEGIYELEEITEHTSFNKGTQKRWIIRVDKKDNSLVVNHDKDFESAYFEKNDPVYFKKYQEGNFKENNLLIKDEDQNYKLVNIRNSVDLKWKKVGADLGENITKDMKFTISTIDVDPDPTKLEENALRGGSVSSGDLPPGYDLTNSVVSDEGRFLVPNIQKGVYALKEESPPEGYKMIDDREIIIQVIPKSMLTQDGKGYIDENTPPLPPIPVDIENDKEELVVRFYEVKLTKNEQGAITSRDLVTNPKEFKYIKVDDKGEVTFDSKGYFDVKNESDKKLGSFKINKTDQDGKTPLVGAVFELKDDETGVVVKEVVSDEQGQVIFTELKPGRYTLTESAAPNGYNKTYAVWNVSVLSDGKTYINVVSGQDNNIPEVTDGIDVSHLIKLDTDSKNISFNDYTGDTQGKAVDDDGKIMVGSEENNIDVAINMSVDGTVNPGDYFTIKESDTLHYNMLQPDKLTYPAISDSKTNDIIAKPQVDPKINMAKGTDKEVIYVFTDAVKGKKDISMSVNWPSSVNENVCRVYGDYDFSVQIGNQELRKNIDINYPEPKINDNLNIIANYQYTNDESGQYTQLAYINPRNEEISGKSTIVVYPEGVSGKFNMANVKSGVTKATLYKLKAGANLPQAVVFDEGIWEPVTNINPQFQTNNQGITAMLIDVDNIGKDSYLLKVDSEMQHPSDGDNTQTTLGQSVQLSNADKFVVWNNSILTNAGGGSGTGEDDYTPPTLDVSNFPEEEKGKFTITKKDEDGVALAGAEFTLYRTKDENGNSITPPREVGKQTSDQEGKIIFEKLNPGEYELKETKAPEGYIATDKTWTIKVDANGITTVSKDTETPQETGFLERLSNFSPMRLFATRSASVESKFVSEPNVKVDKNSFVDKTEDSVTVKTSANYNQADGDFMVSMDITAGDNIGGGAVKKKDIVVILPTYSGMLNAGFTQFKEALNTWLSDVSTNEAYKVGLVTYAGGKATNKSALTNVENALKTIEGITSTSGTNSGVEAAFSNAAGILNNGNSDADKIIVIASGSNPTNTTNLSKAITSITKGSNRLEVYNFITQGNYSDISSNFSKGFGTSVDNETHTFYFLPENDPITMMPKEKEADDYLAKLPKLSTTTPAVNNADVKISFNDNFKFVSGST